MPLGLILICLVFARIIKLPKWKKRLYWTTVIMSILFTNPFLANEVIGVWEYKPVPISELGSSYELAIVLTGVSDNQREPQDRVYFNKGADRVTHTVQLYKMGKIRKVLLSGGSGAFSDPNIMEADNLKRAMVMMGVPDSIIMVENNSKNTHQSAVNVKKLITKYESGRILLITSAFHMPRAYACFEKEGVKTTPFPADFYASKRFFTPNVWIPNPGALQKWTVVFHEIIGFLTYKIMGYA